MTAGNPARDEPDDAPPPPPPPPVEEEDDLPAPPLPPDGGWGWGVVLASMLCNIVVDGVTFTFGVFYSEFLHYYGESSAKTAWAGSLIPGMYLGIGPLVSALANRYGCRVVTMIGGVIASVSLFVSTFSPNVNVLIFTYGICGGIGFGFMYLPSIVIVGFYFDKRRALATGLAVCGSGIGTFLFAPIGQYLLQQFGWKGAYWIISGIVLNGVVCGAIFRPLEANRPRKRPARSEPDVAPDRGVIMQKIIAEKARQRTISTGSLDGSVITKDNTLLRDPDIKQMKNLIMERLIPIDEVQEEVGSGDDSIEQSTTEHLDVPKIGPDGKPLANGDFPLSETVIGPPIRCHSVSSAVNPRKRAKANGNIPSSHHADDDEGLRQVRSYSMSSKVHPNSKPILLSRRIEHLKAEEGTPGNYQKTGRVRTTSGGSDYKSDMGSRGSLASLKSHKETANRPLYRQDIFYSGSVTSIPEYKSNSDMTSYVASITSMPLEEKSCTPITYVLKTMFDFSLLRSVTFAILCIASVVAMIGFFTPFVYITHNAIKLGVSPGKATFLISILGMFNTIGRIISGWVSDRSWADCVMIHNVALVVAGLSTCAVPLLTNYLLLSIYCAVFGSCIAAFISLRSIVLVELLGLEKLTNSFGLLLLFQGIASIIGSPLAGFIYDYTDSYAASFISSGGLIAVAGIICLFVRRVSIWEARREKSSLAGGGSQYTKVSHSTYGSQYTKMSHSVLHEHSVYHESTIIV